MRDARPDTPREDSAKVLQKYTGGKLTGMLTMEVPMNVFLFRLGFFRVLGIVFQAIAA